MKAPIKRLFLLPALMAAVCVVMPDQIGAQSFTTLYNFTGGGDGANPYGGLILSSNKLFGTAAYGGNAGNGTVFAINSDGTGFTNLYSFSAASGRNSSYQPTNNDGAYPSATLVLSGNTIYGTAAGGGAWGKGAVFAINTDGTGFTNLHAFNGSDGSSPQSGLVLSGIALYGTATFGGSAGNGTVFAVNIDGTGFTNLHDFTAASGPLVTNTDGGYPVAGLILSGNTLYGTASDGGSSGAGTVFAINTDGSGFTNLYNFTAVSSPFYINSDGAYPYAGLLLKGNTLFGTAANGGNAGNGTVFALNTDGTDFTNLHNFAALNNYTNNDGANPQAGLILSGDTLFGTALNGGTGGFGTVFAVNTSGTGFTVLHGFENADLPPNTNSDGTYPFDALMLSGNTLYGTAEGGGASGNGTVFSISLAAAPPLPGRYVVGWGGVSLPNEPGSVFTYIGAGWDHGMAIRNDGKLFVWGKNWDGEANVPSGVSNVVAIAGGEQHTLALTADGQVYSWGRIYPAGPAIAPASLSNVTAVAASGDTDLALKSDGTVVAWGNNDSGQTNVPDGLSNVVAIAAEGSSSLALKSNGTVVQWGATNLPDGLTNVIAISCGDYHSLALKNDGTVVAWGDSWGDPTMLDVPADLTNAVAIAAGGDMSFALRSDGTVTGWGADWENQISGATNLIHVVAIAAGYDFGVALRADGSVVAWGENDEGESMGIGTLDNSVSFGAGGFACLALQTNGTVVEWGTIGYSEPLPPAGLSNVVAVASGYGQYLALKSDGTITSWGSDDYGKTTGGSGLSNVVAIAAGGNASLALKADGTVAAWGQAGSPPAGLSNVVAIAAGCGSTIVGSANAFSLALKSDGRVVGWGNNGNGQATPPPDLMNAVAIAAGGFFGMALKSDGTVVAWGDDTYGQATGTAGLSNIVAIAAGFSFGLALKSDGTVIAWGDDSSSQTNIPPTLHNVTAIAGGNFNYCVAIAGDGSPSLTTQPANAFAFVGETTALSTLAAGSPPLSFQWQISGTNIVGATNNVLNLASVSSGDTGQYVCIVSNALGVVTNLVAFAVAEHPPTAFDPTVSQLAADGFHLRLTGLTGHGSVIIYTSTNLVTWEGIFTNPPSLGTLDFVDPSATNAPQFYRASEGP